MRKAGIFSIIVFVLVLAGLINFAIGGQLVRDGVNVPIQAYATDPNKCLGYITAGKVLKIGYGGDHNIAGYTAITFFPVTNGIITYNADATNTMIEPIYAGKANVFYISPYVTEIVPSVACYVSGM